MFQERLPEHAAQTVHNMSEEPAGCFGVFARSIERAGPLWVRGTSWLSQVSGRTVGNISRLPFLNTTLETVIFAQLCAADKAHLRSHSGAGCANALSGCPTAPEFALQPIIPHSRVGNSAH